MSTLTCSPGAAASRRAGRRSASPVQQAAAVVSVVLAAHPVAAWAKDLNLTYTMALPTGASQVSVVNSNSPSTIQAYLLLNLDKDLRGQVTVDRISVSTVGAQSSATAYYDVELYLTGKVLPLSTQQFSSGQNTPLFSITQAPVQYHYVLHQLAPGAVNATGCYDFVADTQCAPADLVPGAVRNVLNTETNGLTAAVFSWSGRPYTAFDISQVTFSFSGKIDNYQITPGLLKKTPVGIPAGDTAFNALSFVSADALVIDGDFTNRSLAKFDNQAELTLNGSFVNLGQAKTSGNIYNNGIFRNASTGTLDVSHYFFNSFFSDGSAGFENAGTVNVGGSTPFFASGPTASFTNSGRFNVNDASLGTAVLLGGTVTNKVTGVIDVQQGEMKTSAGSHSVNDGVVRIQSAGGLTIGGQFKTSGILQNSGLLTNQGDFHAVAGGTFASNGLENIGTLANAKGATLALEAVPLINLGAVSNAGTMQFSGGASVNVATGSFTNTGTVALVVADFFGAAFINQGKFFNNAQGHVTLASQTSFENSGIFANNSGAVFQTAANSAVTNTGSFNNNGGTVIIGGEFVTPGGYIQIGGSTVVNGSMSGNLTLNGGSFMGTANVSGNIIGKNVVVAPGNGPGGSPKAQNGLTQPAPAAPLRAAPATPAAAALGATAQQFGTAAAGVLAIQGDLTLEDSLIDIGINADGAAHLDVEGVANFTSTQVRFVLQDGFQAIPQPGEFLFNWLSAGAVAPESWAGLSYDIGTLGADGNWTPWQAPDGTTVDFADGHLYLAVTVPEPATPALISLGLALLALWPRRSLKPSRHRLATSMPRRVNPGTALTDNR